MPTPVTNFSRDQLAAWCEAAGERAFRADQIRRWIFGKRIASYDEMHDVPAALRGKLAAEFSLFASEIERHQVSRDGTEKLLLRLADGEHVETVLMREENRRTVCISTQVGCGMGCVFCASGLLGLKRNLSTGEILEQILRADRLLPNPTERITNVVVMGIGEPLANLANLLPAVDTLNEKGALGLGARRITISTVGLPDRIRDLAAHGKGYNLAVSLHAPNDRIRNEIVPVSDKLGGLDAILAATDDFFDRTGRRVTFEYVLLAGVNDSAAAASELANRLRGRNAHVNLIPMNAVTDTGLRGPTMEIAKHFAAILEKAGTPATIRKRKGADIDAACGQLRLKAAGGEGTTEARRDTEANLETTNHTNDTNPST